MYKIHKLETLVNLKKGDYLFSEIDDLDYVYYLKEGVFKIVKITKEGNEKVIELLNDNDFIAVVMMLKKRQKYGLSAVALTDATVIKVSKDQMLEAFDNKEIREKFFDFAFAKMVNLADIVANSNNLDESILNCLNILHNKFGKIINNKKILNIPMSKTDLASYVGIRRETLSRKLNELHKKNKIIMNNRKITIL